MLELSGKPDPLSLVEIAARLAEAHGVLTEMRSVCRGRTNEILQGFAHDHRVERAATGGLGMKDAEPAGFACRHLPPTARTPKMAFGHFCENPIEHAWAKLKARLRRVALAERTRYTKRAARRWPPSCPTTRPGFSTIAATFIPNDPQIALAARTGSSVRQARPKRSPGGGIGEGAFHFFDVLRGLRAGPDAANKEAPLSSCPCLHPEPAFAHGLVKKAASGKNTISRPIWPAATPQGSSRQGERNEPLTEGAGIKKEAKRRRGGRLSRRGVHPAPDRRRAAGTERRVGHPAPLHAGRGNGRADPTHHRRRGCTPPAYPDHTQSRMDQGHPNLHQLDGCYPSPSSPASAKRMRRMLAVRGMMPSSQAVARRSASAAGCAPVESAAGP